MIKDYNPYQVDWSNIPDYMDRKDFLELTKRCNGEDTVHTVHFMNWHGKVFGANIIDYQNPLEIYSNIKGIAKMAQLNSKAIRKDYLDHPLNEFIDYSSKLY